MVSTRRMRALAPRIEKRMTVKSSDLPLEITLLVIAGAEVRIMVTLDPHTLYSYIIFDSMITAGNQYEVVPRQIGKWSVNLMLLDDTFIVERYRWWQFKPERILFIGRHSDDETSPAYRIETFGKWRCCRHK